MRSHPIVGSFFLLLGAAFFAAGMFGRWTPPDVPGPIPVWMLIPLVMFQLSVWAVLLGMFFLRSRGRAVLTPARPAL